MAVDNEALAAALRASPGLAFDHLITEFQPHHINPEELNQLILMHGAPVELRRSIKCPCARVETRGPRIGCKVCAALGWVWPEDKREPCIVLVSGRSMNGEYAPPGEMVQGTGVATFPLGIVPGNRDMIVPKGEETVVNETLFRASQQVSIRKLRDRQTTRDVQIPAATRRRELLVYPDLIEIEDLRYIDASEKLIKAREGTDFLLNGREIEWLAGRGPEPGKAFSGRYRAPAAYIINRSRGIARQEWACVMPYKANIERLDHWAERDYRD